MDESLSASVVDWVLDAVTELTATDWAPATTHRGINVGDVLFGALFEAALRAARGEDAASLRRLATPAFSSRVASRLKRLRADWQCRAGAQEISRADVLLWPRLPTHTRQQIPVARQLLVQDVGMLFVACQSRIGIELKGAGLPYVDGHRAFQAQIARGRASAIHVAECLDAPVSVRSRLPGSQAGPDALVDVLRTVIRAQAPVAREAIEIAEAALLQSGAKVLVVGNDLTTEGRAGALVATKLGRHSISHMHGAIGSPAHRGRVVDEYHVFGPADKSWLEDLSVRKVNRRAVVCGAPYLDSVPQRRDRIDQLIAHKAGIRRAASAVLIMTSGPGGKVSFKHHLEMIRALRVLSKEFPDTAFVAKLHPKDREAYYLLPETQVPGARITVIPATAGDIPRDVFHWFHGFSALITGASTSAKEAMLVGLPVISVDLHNQLSDIDFIRAGATHHAQSGAGLSDAVRAALCPESHAPIRKRAIKYLKQCYFGLDGQSAARSASRIVDLCPSS